MNIIKYSKVWFAFSALMIGLSIFTLFHYGLPLGIDFTGGTLLEVQFKAEQPEEISVTTETEGISVEVEEIETSPASETEEDIAEAEPAAEPSNEGVTEIDENGEAIATISGVEEVKPVKTLENITSNDIRNVLNMVAADLGEPSIVTTGENGYIIRIKEIDEDTHKEIKDLFKANLGNFEETRFTTIGPVVGETLKQKAFVAVIIAIIGIILFIAYSFRKVPKKVNPWKFSLTAIVALVHDVIITIGVFAALSHFLGYEANALFITALLTILGYSVNDTIVVFDRIRENLKRQERGETFADIANRSLNQTISRSLNTSLTTLITLTALFLFGGETIKFFVLTLIIGFICGTYSSIFIASPLLVLWRKKSLN